MMAKVPSVFFVVESFQLYPTLCHPLWGFLGKDTGVVCHFLLQPILQVKEQTNGIKWLAQGHAADECLRPDLISGLPHSRLSALSTVPPTARYK